MQCYACGNPETVVKIRKECIFLKCKACGHTSDVDMREKLTTFIVKNPPENKLSKSEEKVKKAEKERMRAAEKEAKKAEKAEAKERKKKERKCELSVFFFKTPLVAREALSACLSHPPSPLTFLAFLALCTLTTGGCDHNHRFEPQQGVSVAQPSLPAATRRFGVSVTPRSFPAATC